MMLKQAGDRQKIIFAKILHHYIMPMMKINEQAKFREVKYILENIKIS